MVKRFATHSSEPGSYGLLQSIILSNYILSKLHALLEEFFFSVEFVYKRDIKFEDDFISYELKDTAGSVSFAYYDYNSNFYLNHSNDNQRSHCQSLLVIINHYQSHPVIIHMNRNSNDHLNHHKNDHRNH